MAGRDFKSVKIKPVSAAVQLLEKQLQSADPDIRKTAYTSVPKLKAPTDQVLELGGKLLHHENWFVRAAAADTLSYTVLREGTGDGAIKTVGALLDDLDPETRRVAARSLVDIALQPRLPEAVNSGEIKEEMPLRSRDYQWLEDEIVKIQSRRAKNLETGLVEAFQAMADFMEVGDKFSMELPLEDDSEEKAIAEIDAFRVNFLAKAMKLYGPKKRNEFSAELDNLQGRREEAAKKIAQSKKREAEVIACIQEKKKLDGLSVLAAKELATKLNDPDPDVRENCIEFMSRMDFWARPYAAKLANLLGDKQAYVRHAAVRAIDRLGTIVSDASVEMAKWFEHDEEAVRYCAKEALLTLAKYDGKAAAQGGVKFLKSKNPRTRYYTLQLMLELKGYAAKHGEAIAALLEDPEIYIRAFVARVLVAAGKEEPKKVGSCLNAILKRMEHEDEDVRRVSVDCLGALAKIIDKFARSQGRVFMEDLADIEDQELVTQIKIRAITVLGQAGDNAKPYLVDLIKEMESKDWRLRRAVLHCMEDLGPSAEGEGALEVSRRLLHAEPDVRRSAAECLGKMGRYAGEYSHRVEALLDTEEDEDVLAVLQIASARLNECGILDATSDASPTSPGTRTIADTILLVQSAATINE